MGLPGFSLCPSCSLGKVLRSRARHAKFLSPSATLQLGQVLDAVQMALPTLFHEPDLALVDEVAQILDTDTTLGDLARREPSCRGCSSYNQPLAQVLSP